MAKKEILVVGSAALDTVEAPAGKVDDILGGSSFYFSTAASLLAPVRLVAVTGSDFPKEKIEFLKSRDVDLNGLETAEGETFRWGGRYYEDPNKRDTLFTKLGVFEQFQPKIPEHFKSTPLVFLGNIHPALQSQVLDQIENPDLVVMDTMNFWINGTPGELKEVLKRVDVIMINDEEATDLTGKTDLLAAVDQIYTLGPKNIVIKKGQHGAMLFRDNGEMFSLPAYPVRKVVDPTGAGDTFAGGFMGYLASHPLEDKMTWRRAVLMGSVLGGFVVEDFSMEKTKVLTQQDIDRRIEQYKELVSF